MDLKRCCRCKTEKPRSEFNRDRSTKDGLQSSCIECRRYYNHRPEGKTARAKYQKTLLAKAKRLRSAHDFDRPTSLHWAEILMRPQERCAICGIPNQILAAYVEYGSHWILGRAKSLTLDHVLPGVNNGDYRALCHACNAMRGAARFTDEEVLNEVRDKWRATIGLRFLWWLNTTPGVGGQLNRSETCAKRDARFAAGTPTTPPPPTPPPSSPSTSETPPVTSAE
jgi:hypothetical protein